MGQSVVGGRSGKFPPQSMSITKFRDEDRAYLDWAAAHDHGYVVDVRRSMNPADARVHRASCGTITGNPTRGRRWTRAYVKYCSESLRELEAWARGQFAAPLTHCRRCQP
jgi:hypothetical protein